MRWSDLDLDGDVPILTVSGTIKTKTGTGTSERVDAETASQQLGHFSPAITREFYISKPAIAADVAHVLDELAEADPEGGPNLREQVGNSAFGFK